MIIIIIKEDYYNIIENRGARYLKSLKSEDMSFYRNLEERGDFLYYLFAQYFRTSKIRNNYLNILKKRENPYNIDLIKVHKLILLGLANNAATNISLGNDYDIGILKAPDNYFFITSDQPVVNTAWQDINHIGNVKSLAIHYPISPNKAIFLKKGTGKINNSIIINYNTLNWLNQSLVDFSFQQIYSSNEGDLLNIFSDNISS